MGAVFVEPLNTSGGAEIDAVWALIGPMLEENGDAWIGVTERAGAADALKTFDPQRYAGLDLPVNDYAWDILRQVGALTKEGGSQSPLQGLTAEHTYMGGFSQSGVEVGTYANAFHDTASMSDGTPVYDGYLPAGHASSLTPLQSGAAALPKFEFAPISAIPVPVIDLETQSDVEGFEAEINPDDHLHQPRRRPGASCRQHHGNRQVPAVRDRGSPPRGQDPRLRRRRLHLPHRLLRPWRGARLFAWAEEGIAPTEAPRLDLAVRGRGLRVQDRRARQPGGRRALAIPRRPARPVRGPLHPRRDLRAVRARDTLPAEVLAGRYAGVDDYMAQFTEDLDSTIDAGYLRPEDRQAILDQTRTKAQGLLG